MALEDPHPQAPWKIQGLSIPQFLGLSTEPIAQLTKHYWEWPPDPLDTAWEILNTKLPTTNNKIKELEDKADNTDFDSVGFNSLFFPFTPSGPQGSFLEGPISSAQDGVGVGSMEDKNFNSAPIFWP